MTGRLKTSRSDQRSSDSEQVAKCMAVIRVYTAQQERMKFCFRTREF